MSQPTPSILVSRDEIRAAHAQGEAATIALVERLIETINDLQNRVETLENQRKKDSQNSSKPPSGDGFGKRTKSLRPKGNNSSGGQPQHPGSTLEWRETIDEIIEHPIDTCEHCGTSLANAPVEQWDIRQVHDLPPLELVVSEHRAEMKICPHCGSLNRAAFPADITNSIQYGAHLKSLLVYLMDGQLLPSERICDLMSEVFSCELSEGTLYNARHRCHEQLAPLEEHLKSAIQTAEVAQFDETGMRVNGKLMWLHVACTAGLTYYAIHPKRGKPAMDAMGILPTFSGVSVHDGWASYASYGCDHALCNAHHLRELRFIIERYQQGWADQMMALLVEIKHQVEVTQDSGQSVLTPAQVMTFEQRYRQLLEQGFQANPPPVIDPEAPKCRGRVQNHPARNLLNRLHTHQAAVLRFMYDFRVPFDNNQAERDIRMMKLKQKISGGFRSLEGGEMFCRIRGYISTLRKRGIPILNALRSVFLGEPISPLPQPE